MLSRQPRDLTLQIEMIRLPAEFAAPWRRPVAGRAQNPPPIRRVRQRSRRRRRSVAPDAACRSVLQKRARCGRRHCPRRLRRYTGSAGARSSASTESFARSSPFTCGQRTRECTHKGAMSAFLLNRCITGFDRYTANLGHAHGQDPKRSPATTEPLPLAAHSLLPALRARRMDRPGRPQGDNDIVERLKNPSKALPRAP